jgi:hypothetical protein
MNRPLRGALRAVVVLALALSTSANAQVRQASLDRGGVSDSALAQITARGRTIAGYQEATWRATAKLRASQSDAALRHVAFHTDSGWTVAFGRLSTSRDTFYVSHLAAPALIDGCRVDSLMQISTLATPAADTGYVLRAARAVDTAVALFGRTSRPYESVVLPAPGGAWWVYMLPSPNGAGAYPLGDDMRYHVSADARRVSEARRLHLGTIEFDRTNKPDAQYVASSHTTAVSDIPEETDVAHVLTRRPRVLGYVFTPQYLYMINEDGSLRMVMPRMRLIGAQR